MFAQFSNDTFSPGDTFVLRLSYESHIIIDINGVLLYDAIHNFLNQHNVPPVNFTYETGNFKGEQAYTNWRNTFNITDPPIQIKTYPGCSAEVNTDIVPIIKDTARPYKYVNLNNAPHIHRIELINWMYQRDLLQYGKNSFHMAHHLLIKEIFDQIPMEVDQLGPNHHDVDQDHLFVDNYFSIITESIFGRPIALPVARPKPYEEWWVEGHVTEKTFRAFFHLHPFILVGASGSLAYLRSLGYQTFDGYIDESYDKIENHSDRMLAVQAEITKLCALDLDSLRQWYASLTPILQHNQARYLKEKWTNVNEYYDPYYLYLKSLENGESK